MKQAETRVNAMKSLMLLTRKITYKEKFVY